MASVPALAPRVWRAAHGPWGAAHNSQDRRAVSSEPRPCRSPLREVPLRGRPRPSPRTAPSPVGSPRTGGEGRSAQAASVPGSRTKYGPGGAPVPSCPVRSFRRSGAFGFRFWLLTCRFAEVLTDRQVCMVFCPLKLCCARSAFCLYKAVGGHCDWGGLGGLRCGPAARAPSAEPRAQGPKARSAALALRGVGNGREGR